MTCLPQITLVCCHHQQSTLGLAYSHDRVVDKACMAGSVNHCEAPFLGLAGAIVHIDSKCSPPFLFWLIIQPCELERRSTHLRRLGSKLLDGDVVNCPHLVHEMAGESGLATIKLSQNCHTDIFLVFRPHINILLKRSFKRNKVLFWKQIKNARLWFLEVKTIINEFRNLTNIEYEIWGLFLSAAQFLNPSWSLNSESWLLGGTLFSSGHLYPRNGLLVNPIEACSHGNMSL